MNFGQKNICNFVHNNSIETFFFDPPEVILIAQTLCRVLHEIHNIFNMMFEEIIHIVELEKFSMV